MKIMMGICGIGNGHTFRQLPIFEHLHKQGHTLMIFAYGASYDFFKKNHGDKPRVHIIEVANPYYVGDRIGLNFYASQHHPANKKDFHQINCAAMQQANEIIGKPDLVISDYECTSAQYAYAKGAKLITLDQQSKFLVGKFDKDIHGTTCTDEIERLRMLFPRVDRRLAISFFNVESAQPPSEHVEIFAPIVRQEVLALKNHLKSENTSILMYFTAQQSIAQSSDSILSQLKDFSNVDFHIFFPKSVKLIESFDHIKCYHHGDKRYANILGAAHGVITTAGHTLLSELLFLEKPIYALPLNLYEQQINAKVIQDNGFGLSRDAGSPCAITQQTLRTFLNNLKRYEAAIRSDQTVLLKGSGFGPITEAIDETLGLSSSASLRL